MSSRRGWGTSLRCSDGHLDALRPSRARTPRAHPDRAHLAVAGVFTQIAIGSGQELKRQLVNERNPLVGAHTRIAEDIRPWLLLFFVALGAFLFFERRLRTAGTSVSLRNPLLAGTFVAAIAFAGVSCYWVYRIGHTGAKAVWVEKIQRESGK